jgi:pSer/pThr/pTyr-binding forkhead associated (FHA) protein
MDFAGKAQKIERKLARSLDAAIGELVGREEPAPLEIVHAVLDRAEREIQEVGRGRRVFPFNAVRVVVFAGTRDREARARLDAVIAGPPSLGDRLAERLAAAGCARVAIAIETAYVKQRGSEWEDPRFHVAFDRVDAQAARSATAPARGAVPRIKLTIVKGSAAQRVYVFTGGRIDIGRRAEVVDQHQRLIRTNQIAFAEDGADENQSVSRRHAHIEFADGCYRIRDDRSAHGTSLVRNGRTIKVVAGARGAKLSPGDEIVLGHARLRVAIDS